MANLFFGTFNDSRPYCHHGISQFCPLCEDGKNYLKKCSTCGIKIWAGKTEKINHVAGNPMRQKLASLIWNFRNQNSEKKDVKKDFLNIYSTYKELFIASQNTKNALSIYVGNFQSKNLHTIKS